MNKLEEHWLALRQLDELAAGGSLIHALHPGVKLLVTLLFLAATASYAKYEFSAMLPLCLYPIVLISLGNVPWRPVLRRLLLGLPFVLFLGVFNPLLDHTPLLQLGPLLVTGGVVSFFSILLRFCLAVLAVLALIATTGIDALCAATRLMRVPQVLVNQFLFTYRYLYVLLEEVGRTVRAYSLRSPENGRIGFRAWGSLVGLLLLRSVDRAQRIHQAMLCRGFDGEIRLVRCFQLRLADVLFLFGWTGFFLLARMVNLPQGLGTLLTGR